MSSTSHHTRTERLPDVSARSRAAIRHSGEGTSHSRSGAGSRFGAPQLAITLQRIRRQCRWTNHRDISEPTLLSPSGHQADTGLRGVSACWHTTHQRSAVQRENKPPPPPGRPRQQEGVSETTDHHGGWSCWFTTAPQAGGEVAGSVTKCQQRTSPRATGRPSYMT